MLWIRVLTVLFLVSSSSVANAQAPDSDDAAEEGSGSDDTEGWWWFGAGTGVFAIPYGFSVGVSLTSDPRCQGDLCYERYLSFVPVVGGFLQIAAAGSDFHEDHHSDGCIPLMIAAAVGQGLGVASMIYGLWLLLSEEEEDGNTVLDDVMVSATTYDDTGLGLQLAVRGL